MTSQEKTAKLAAAEARIKSIKISLDQAIKNKSALASTPISSDTTNEDIQLEQLIPEDINNLNYVEDIENPINIKVTLELLKDIAHTCEDLPEFISEIKDKEWDQSIKKKYRQDLDVWIQSHQLEFLIDSAIKSINNDILKSGGKTKLSLIYSEFYNLYH